ncbi:hypothetical protein [Caldinitratiruptor microaerophilus]|uniref:DUF1641 domain-containing protein n=1 Tax=Caldinitratiruptor microaerophilus TaxID=671077 RepID=A0AA35G9P2_9FIRM|nr:hypothetical protein [Caldinitratiruptor microaerophilus]BDG62286.1 hypothetical protein caldi_33760 [Caldinitratiruptor microaerophilus]
MEEREVQSTPTGLAAELATVAEAARAAATPAMVDRLAVMAERAVTALDVLASPEVLDLLVQLKAAAPALNRALGRLVPLIESGGLDDLLDLVEVLRAVKASATDGMIARAGDKINRGLELLDAIMQLKITHRLPELLAAIDDAARDAEQNQEFLSPLAVLAAPREKEIQHVMRFMLALARRLPAALQS